MKDLTDLLQDTLRDCYNSEQQIVKGLQEMEQSAEDAQLKKAFAKHLEQTRQHVQRLEQVCQALNFSPSGKVCHGTMGIIQEAKEDLESFKGSQAGDACLIANAQKIEHYEICNYGTAISWMQEMDIDDELIDLLETTLQEEEETDDLLTSIAEDTVNQRALQSWRKSKSTKASLI